MSARTLTVYSRRSCPSCEEMIAELEFSPQVQGFELEVIDVDTAPGLAETYGWHVPVLLLDGREVCRHAFDSEKLHQHLVKHG